MIGRRIAFAIILVSAFATEIASADWKIDFSRRTNEIRQREFLATDGAPKDETLFDAFLSTGEPVQELVVLNTERGFVPKTVRVREGQQYKIHIVNVNDKEKNVSFVMDSFSEHHATYYGQIKTFEIKPRKEGIYSFQCPETSAQGRLVVHPAINSTEIRMPASE